MANSKPAPPPGKSAQELQDFLSSLDELGAPPAGPAAGAKLPSAAPSTTVSRPATASGSGAPPAGAQDAQSVLDFLDEITQRSSTPTAPVPEPAIARKGSGASLRAAAGVPARKSIEIARAERERALTSTSPRVSKNPSPVPPAAPSPTPAPAPSAPAAGGWGWGSVWNSASSALQQAKSVADQARHVAEENLAKNLPAGTGARAADVGEQAKKWREGVLGLVKQGIDVEKLGANLRDTSLRTFTDIMNAVAPPISEHEVITVTLSHDMLGYEGVETLVYRALAKVMEQVEGGDLVVNKGGDDTASSTDAPPSDDDRDLRAVPGFEAGHKLARSSLDALLAAAAPPPPKPEAAPSHERTGSSGSVLAPVTVCPVYMRIQPLLAPLPGATPVADKELPQHLFFLLLLRDPEHDLEHSTLSQALPGPWLDIPFEENEWVEDAMVEIIRRAVETIGQEYVHARQYGRQRAAQAALSDTAIPGIDASAIMAASAGI